MEGKDKKTGRFTSGNQWWRQRTKHGRDVLFSDPEILREECYKYFELTDSRKWNKVDYKGKDVEKVLIPTETPYTISGLCVYLGIHIETWRTYKDRPDLVGVIKDIENIMYTHKFEGATTGAFNANIIARDLGLADKKEIEQEITVETVTVFELPNNSRENGKEIS